MNVVESKSRNQLDYERLECWFLGSTTHTRPNIENWRQRHADNLLTETPSILHIRAVSPEMFFIALILNIFAV
jgi:hypothetical protein